MDVDRRQIGNGNLHSQEFETGVEKSRSVCDRACRYAGRCPCSDTPVHEETGFGFSNNWRFTRGEVCFFSGGAFIFAFVFKDALFSFPLNKIMHYYINKISFYKEIV